MARRRRRRYTWFPNLGTGSAFTNGDLTGRQITLGVNLNGSPSTVVVPLTFDFPNETVQASVAGDTPLGDFIGNEYIIERIVGNMFYNISSAGNANTGGAVLVTAGIFVARADDANPDIPIGSAAAADEINNYSPQFTNNIREPWMFRRTWLLGAQLGVNDGTGALVTTTTVGTGTVVNAANRYAYPQSNVFYGTAVGGPYVDVKSSRRVGQDERLFWVTAAQTWPVDTVDSGIINVGGLFDYRILGTLVKPHNRSTF